MFALIGQLTIGSSADSIVRVSSARPESLESFAQQLRAHTRAPAQSESGAAPETGSLGRTSELAGTLVKG